jgi:ABC-type branched-subunit amino acid transport system ATPase component
VGDTRDLRADDVTVRYGGALALEGVSLAAGTGRITSLIGPNGAGKTTFFNVCSGVVRPVEGRVSVGGLDVTSRSIQARARLGLGRTFQRMELFGSMTVAENIALGREARLAGQRPWDHLRAPAHQRRDVATARDRVTRLCGLEALSDRPVRDLSTGQQRLVELARVVAGGFSLLLLDEPSSGLDVGETEVFGEILCGLVREQDLGILLVEHDMGLVMSVSDHVYVLDFGRLIFDGSPEAAQGSTVVREAYLGAGAS